MKELRRRGPCELMGWSSEVGVRIQRAGFRVWGSELSNGSSAFSVGHAECKVYFANLPGSRASRGTPRRRARSVQHAGSTMQASPRRSTS